MNQSHAKQTQHRFHTTIAAIPVLILCAAFILDLYNLPTTSSEPSLTLASTISYLIAAGLIGMLVVSIPGLADYSYMHAEEPVGMYARRHFWFNVLAFVAFGASLAVRWTYPVSVGPPLIPLATAAFGIGFLAYAGYMGYRIIYPPAPSEDLISYDSEVESRPPTARTTNPGTTAKAQWKQAEVEEQRWRVEPRVDADGDSI